MIRKLALGLLPLLVACGGGSGSSSSQSSPTPSTSTPQPAPAPSPTAPTPTQTSSPAPTPTQTSTPSPTPAPIVSQTAPTPTAIQPATPAPIASETPPAAPVTPFALARVDPEFDFASSQEVQLDVQVADDTGLALGNVLVEVRAPDGTRLSAILTDGAGNASTRFQIPGSVQAFEVYVHTLGIPNQRQFSVAETVTASFGGA